MYERAHHAAIHLRPVVTIQHVVKDQGESHKDFEDEHDAKVPSGEVPASNFAAAEQFRDDGRGFDSALVFAALFREVQ
jgi:hypothetical protein